MLEQEADPASPLKRLPFGRRGLWAPAIEAIYRRGWLDDLVASSADQGGGPPGRGAPAGRRPSGYFAGMPVFEDAASAQPWRLPGPADAMLTVDTQTLETVLAARAAALGVDIRRGLGVEGVVAEGDKVRIQGGGETIVAPWLVGCDGGRSAVRKAAGFDFAGTEPEVTGYSVLVDLADPDAIPPGMHRSDGGMFTYGPPGLFLMLEFDGGAFDRGQPVSREHVQAVLRRVTGVEVEVIALRQATTWTDRACQATRYRRGRLLLAGDAAHIHSPQGGQGLNLGLGDAMNLGWKLAATVKDRAPPGLLDSYERERMPVGAAVLELSRAQIALARPAPASRALETIIRDLIQTSGGAAYFTDRASGRALRYDLGDGHPLVGRSAPDFVLADGSRLGDHLRGGQGLLLDFDGRPALRSLAARRLGLGYLACDAENRLGLTALLVRPDGVVAWAAEGEPDPEAAAQAAARWIPT